MIQLENGFGNLLRDIKFGDVIVMFKCLKAYIFMVATHWSLLMFSHNYHAEGRSHNILCKQQLHAIACVLSKECAIIAIDSFS